MAHDDRELHESAHNVLGMHDALGMHDVLQILQRALATLIVGLHGGHPQAQAMSEHASAPHAHRSKEPDDAIGAVALRQTVDAGQFDLEVNLSLVSTIDRLIDMLEHEGRLDHVALAQTPDGAGGRRN